MHAVVVRVTIGDREQAEPILHSQVVPRVSQAPGFKAGYWTSSQEGGQETGISMVIFDSEENARAAADQVRQAVPPTVTIGSVDVREVVASA
jgi:heme-degrading monooxygenase HmoA